MTQSVVTLIDGTNGRAIFSSPYNFAEPRTMIILNAASGSTFKRVQPIDNQINITLGANLSTAPPVTDKPFARRGFWLVDMNGVYPDPLPYWATGVTTKVNWSTLEPSPGVYDFSTWLAVLNKMKSQNKRACLSIWTGSSCPAWLYSAPHNVVSYTATLSAGGSNKVPMHWTGTYEQRWSMLMQAAYSAVVAADLYNSVDYIKVTMASASTAELRWPSEYGGYVAGTEAGMAAAGWRPTLAKDSINRMVNATAAIWGVLPYNSPLGLDVAMSSEFFMVPHIDDSGTIGAVQHVFAPILDNMITLAGAATSCHSDALGLGGPTDGIDSIILPYVNTVASVGGQVAEKNFGWPQCTPGQKPNCPWTPQPGGRPTATCDQAGFEAICRYVKGQGAKFIEVFGGTSTCYPDIIAQMTNEFNWLPQP